MAANAGPHDSRDRESSNDVRRSRIRRCGGGLKGNPIRILQISDLHVGPIVQKAYVENVVDMILKEKPEIIFATGDIGDGSVDSLAESLEPLRKLTVCSKLLYSWKS